MSPILIYFLAFFTFDKNFCLEIFDFTFVLTFLLILSTYELL